MVKFLVREGRADVNQAKQNGDIPFLVAARGSHFYIVELLSRLCSSKIARLPELLALPGVPGAMAAGAQSRWRPVLESALQTPLLCLPHPGLAAIVIEYSLPADIEESESWGKTEKESKREKEIM